MNRLTNIAAITCFLLFQLEFQILASQKDSSIQMVHSNVFVFVAKDGGEDHSPEISIFQLIEQAKLRIKHERSMNQRTIMIAQATAEAYAIADEHKIDIEAVQGDIERSLAPENKICINWQYIDEWLKQTTRTEDNPEWTQEERDELYQAKGMYARLRKLSEQSRYDKSDLQYVLSDYVVLNPGLQESIRLAVQDKLQIDEHYVEMVVLPTDDQQSLLKNDRSLYVFINYNSCDDEEKSV